MLRTKKVQAIVSRIIIYFSESRVRNFGKPSVGSSFNILSPWIIITRMLGEAALRKLIYMVQGENKLLDLAKLRGSARGKSLLILAGGPSLDSFSKSQIDRIIGSKYQIMSVNRAFQSSLAKITGVDYFIFSDPNHHPTNSEGMYKEVGSQTNLGRGTVLLPRHWPAPIPVAKATVFYEDLELLCYPGKPNPTRFRNFPSLTALKGISIANYLSFDRIYVLGLDGSEFQGLRVDAHNNLLQRSVHASGAASYVELELSDHYPRGVEDYFFDAAMVNHWIRRRFGKIRILNLNPESFVDTFPKLEPNR